MYFAEQDQLKKVQTLTGLIYLLFSKETILATQKFEL
jgi:hypothetical protein